MAGVVGQVSPHQQIDAYLGGWHGLAEDGARAAELLHPVGAAAQLALAVAAPAAVAPDVEHRAGSRLVTAPGLAQVGALRVLAARAVREAALEVLVQAWAPDPGDCGPD